MKMLVVGCGSIGRRHAANATAWASVAVVDAAPEAARACADATGATGFTSLDEALGWRPDAVIVATPHRSHLPIARRAVDAGADVLIEKPLSHSREGVDDFLRALEQRGRRAYVVCNMRFHPGPATLRREAKRVGRPLFARAHVGNYLPAMRPGRDYRELYAARRAEGGGVVLDAVHEIDYLSWLFERPLTVGCRAGKLSELDIDVEDYALVALTHRSGVESSVELDYLRPRKSRGCEIVGTEGVLVWHSDGKEPERCSVRFCESGAREWETLIEVASVDATQPYRDMMHAFVSELERPGSTDLLNAHDAAAVLDTALGALASAARQGAAQPVNAEAESD